MVGGFGTNKYWLFLECVSLDGELSRELGGSQTHLLGVLLFAVFGCKGRFDWGAQSVGAMGGVYKGQGHNQHELMTCDYKAFLVQDQELQESISVMGHLSRLVGPVVPRQTRFMSQCSVHAT